MLALSRCLLEFFNDPAVGTDAPVWGMDPWTNNIYLQVMGIESVDLAAGLQLTERRWSKLTQDEWKYFSPENQKAAQLFLEKMRSRIIPDTKGEAINLVQNVLGHEEYKNILSVLLSARGSVIDVVWEVIESTGSTPTQAYINARMNNEVRKR
jgi:hypothetical protein